MNPYLELKINFLIGLKPSLQGITDSICTKERFHSYHVFKVK
ncbi:hypothetical protein EVA_05511 [gut metagenome]|uniref:Uncharacterized protein n=1 Tax=gut metagenome TaxID=749906 RepID=J9GG81_9ZZZZ